MLPQIATPTDILPTDHSSGLSLFRSQKQQDTQHCITDFHFYLPSDFHGQRGFPPLVDSSG
jgi:hypothetical protein